MYKNKHFITAKADYCLVSDWPISIGNVNLCWFQSRQLYSKIGIVNTQNTLRKHSEQKSILFDKLTKIFFISFAKLIENNYLILHVFGYCVCLSYFIALPIFLAVFRVLKWSHSINLWSELQCFVFCIINVYF